MASRTLQKHYLRIARLWPQDRLRGIKVPDALRHRLEARLLKQPGTAPPASSSGTAQIQTPQTPPAALVAPINDAAELEQVNALYSLLEDRYSIRYQPSRDLLEPTSNPSYYTDLAAEMEAAPKRGWLARKWLRWSKVVRLS